MPRHSPHGAYKSKIVLHVRPQQGVFFAVSDVGGGGGSSPSHSGRLDHSIYN